MAIHESHAAPDRPFSVEAPIKPLPEPPRPYLKDDRDPNQIQDEVHRQFYGEHYKSSTLRPQLAYLVPEIVPFDPEWMDPATGLMVNVPNDPDFLSSFTFKRVDASLAIGTYGVDLSYDFPGGGQGSGSSYHGDGIMRFSISRKQIRQELPRERTAIIWREHRVVHIRKPEGGREVWVPYRVYRRDEKGVHFDTVWHRLRRRKFSAHRMPETLGGLFTGLTDIFASMLHAQGLDLLTDEFDWACKLAQMEADATCNRRLSTAPWTKWLTGVESHRIWLTAVTALQDIKDLSKAERYSDEGREITKKEIRRTIERANGLIEVWPFRDGADGV